MIVVDASIVVTALADDGPDGDRCRARLAGERLAAPDLLDLEVMSAWRRLHRGGQLSTRRVNLALEDLASLRVARAPALSLLARCWQLRDNLTPYDASYVALAERLDVPVVTGDRRLTRAPGITCRVELIDAHL